MFLRRTQSQDLDCELNGLRKSKLLVPKFGKARYDLAQSGYKNEKTCEEKSHAVYMSFAIDMGICAFERTL